MLVLGNGVRVIPVPISGPRVRVLSSGGRVREIEGAKRRAELGV